MEYHFAVRNCQDWVKQFLTSIDEAAAFAKKLSSNYICKFKFHTINGMEYHFAVRNCQDWVKQFLTSVDEDLLQHLPKTLRRTVLVSLNVTLF